MMTMTTVGTPIYVAPEVEFAFAKMLPFRGDYKRADVFSLGLIFHQLLFNRPVLPDGLDQLPPRKILFTVRLRGVGGSWRGYWGI
jgi:serine/threonine protein kinase